MSTDKNKSLRLDLYRSMRRIRRAEEVLIEEYHPADEMRCPIHFCVGQEAAPAALGLTLERDDVVISHYRSHGYYMAKGAPLAAMVAEFYGKATGSNHGVAGSMELAHHDTKIYSGAIVGGSAGLAVGSAFAQKYQDTRSITVAVFGDGAMDEGVGYEAINLAMLYGLPVLFLCENNHYAAHTPLADRTRAASLAGRAAAFGIQVAAVSDSDPEALLEVMSRVTRDVREQQKPFFLEVETYRFCGHVGPENDDVMAYRPEDEIADRKSSDPLLLLRGRIESSPERSELARIDGAIETEIREAIAQAKTAPFPTSDWAGSIIATGTYDPIVTTLIEGSVGQFKGAQAESKLAPY